MSSNQVSNCYCDGSFNGEVGLLEPQSKLTSSASFKPKKKPAPSISRAGSEVDELITLLHGSDPVRVELSRLENEVREIKALKYSERVKEKAVEELSDELKKEDKKLKATEALLESKNLEIKKINEKKKEALSAQFAVEATLRRVHAAQKDDEMPPIEAIITPLEAELKLTRLEVTKLQDDNRALDRLTKSKEAALLEAERNVQMAFTKASLVDDSQNKNQELMKQIEICQEENRILDKMHRQKVAEVEKLTQSVRELEEAVLAGGAAANAVRDYQRKVLEMNEEKRILDRELARAKISANRVAVVVANEWKDSTDKVMPVKQWLEERRQFQGEMQLLKDKLAIVERTAKAEAQLKEKYQLQFKVLEERLRLSQKSIACFTSQGGSASGGLSRCQSIGGAECLSRPSFNEFLLKKTKSQSKSFQRNGSALLELSKNSSIVINSSSGALEGENIITSENELDNGLNNSSHQIHNNGTVTKHENGRERENGNINCADKIKLENEDYVSGMLYDMLQKEVITLRKACQEKDRSLKDKDDAIEMLAKKVETLNKAMEVESKKMRREVAAMEKEVASVRLEKEQDQRLRRVTSARGPYGTHPHSIR